MASPLKSPSAGTGPKIIRGVDFNELRYFLNRIHSAIDEAVVLGRPETSKMVELRALIMMLSKIITPAFDN
jgi:hypothetical protein